MLLIRAAVTRFHTWTSARLRSESRVVCFSQRLTCYMKLSWWTSKLELKERKCWRKGSYRLQMGISSRMLKWPFLRKVAACCVHNLFLLPKKAPQLSQAEVGASGRCELCYWARWVTCVEISSWRSFLLRHRKLCDSSVFRCHALPLEACFITIPECIVTKCSPSFFSPPLLLSRPRTYDGRTRYGPLYRLSPPLPLGFHCRAACFAVGVDRVWKCTCCSIHGDEQCDFILP